MYIDEEEFKDTDTANTYVTPLVYRKPQKSASKIGRGQRSYDWKEMLSISPRMITRYSRNFAPDTLDYTDYFVGLGATVLPDGTIDKSTIVRQLTEDKSHHGIISKKVNRRVNLVIDWMVLLSTVKDIKDKDGNYLYSFKLNFVTLTLPSKQVHGDKQIVDKCIQPFLDWCRRSKKVKYYFWRAETQANGNIHFHICTDVFLPWLELKVKWNSIVNKLGYVDRFAEKWNHRTPNSTDVHSLKQVKNVARYLAKYCGKNSKGVVIQLSKAKYYREGFPFLLLATKWYTPPQKAKFFRQVYCRLWACSENLSKLKNCQTMDNAALSSELLHFEKHYPHRVFTHDYSKSYMIDCTELKGFNYVEIRKVLVQHVMQIFNPPET